jgi:hypothetical protein
LLERLVPLDARQPHGLPGRDGAAGEQQAHEPPEVRSTCRYLRANFRSR